ncbi:MAG: hypothetical protein AAFZ09_12885 [Pseudomonadota bacterium]
MSDPEPVTSLDWAARVLAAAFALGACWLAYQLVFEIRGLTADLPRDLARSLSVLRYPLAGLALIAGVSLLRPWVDRALSALGSDNRS